MNSIRMRTLPDSCRPPFSFIIPTGKREDNEKRGNKFFRDPKIPAVSPSRRWREFRDEASSVAPSVSPSSGVTADSRRWSSIPRSSGVYLPSPLRHRTDWSADEFPRSRRDPLIFARRHRAVRQRRIVYTYQSRGGGRQWKRNEVESSGDGITRRAPICHPRHRRRAVAPCVVIVVGAARGGSNLAEIHPSLAADSFWTVLDSSRAHGAPVALMLRHRWRQPAASMGDEDDVLPARLQRLEIDHRSTSCPQ